MVSRALLDAARQSTFSCAAVRRRLLPGTRAYTAATLRARARAVNSDDEPIYFVDEAAGGAVVSAWHDIPLRGGAPRTWNLVVEIPRGARAKLEIAPSTPYTPLVQDTNADGSKRFYGLDSIVNYGALPQTWEDPAHVDSRTGVGGDGDPLDVCEIGSATASVGDIYPVKVIGALALIDGGETDWKVRGPRAQRRFGSTPNALPRPPLPLLPYARAHISPPLQLLAIRATDPLAAQVDCVGDMSKVPAAVARIAADVAHWFRVYKVAEGKKENQLAFGGKWLGRDAAEGIILETHKHWQRAVDARPVAGGPLRYGFDAAVDAAAPHMWLPHCAAWKPRTGEA